MAGISIQGLASVKREIRSVVEDVIQETQDTVYKEVRATTPVRTGNAKKNWRKSSTRGKLDVVNRVPYIERLEDGWSRKAPNGMVGPTLAKLK